MILFCLNYLRARKPKWIKKARCKESKLLRLTALLIAMQPLAASAQEIPAIPARPGSGGNVGSAGNAFQSLASATGAVTVGRSLVIDFANSPVLSLTNNLRVPAGSSVYVVSTNPMVNTATISAPNIFASPGSTISSVLPSGGFNGFSNAISGLNLSLVAQSRLINQGTISSAGNLNIFAGQEIHNLSSQGAPQAVMQAIGNLNLFSPHIVNQGLVSSVAANININSPAQFQAALASVLNNANLPALLGSTITMSGTGQYSAFDAINIAGPEFDSSSKFSLFAGDFLSKSLNIDTGNATLGATLGNVTGLTNVSGRNLHFGSSTVGTLNLGAICAIGDPTFFNDKGGIQLNADLSNSVGEAMIFLTSGDFDFNGHQITSTAAGIGQDIMIVAGAKVIPDGAATPNPAIPGGKGPLTAGTVSVSAGGTGGSIIGGPGAFITASGTGTDANAGNVTLIAFADSKGAAGSISDIVVFASGNGNGNNGSITAIAGGGTNSIKGMDFSSGIGKGSGVATLSVSAATPVISGKTGTITFDATAKSSGGAFVAAANTGAAIQIDQVTTPGYNVSISGGSVNVTTFASSVAFDGRRGGDVSIITDKAGKGVDGSIVIGGTLNAFGADGVDGIATLAQPGGNGGNITLIAGGLPTAKIDIFDIKNNGGAGGDGGVLAVGGKGGNAGNITIKAQGDVLMGAINDFGGTAGGKGGNGGVPGLAGGNGGNAGQISISSVVSGIVKTAGINPGGGGGFGGEGNQGGGGGTGGLGASLVVTGTTLDLGRFDSHTKVGSPAFGLNQSGGAGGKGTFNAAAGNGPNGGNGGSGGSITLNVSGAKTAIAVIGSTVTKGGFGGDGSDGLANGFSGGAGGNGGKAANLILNLAASTNAVFEDIILDGGDGGIGGKGSTRTVGGGDNGGAGGNGGNGAVAGTVIVNAKNAGAFSATQLSMKGGLGGTAGDGGGGLRDLLSPDGISKAGGNGGAGAMAGSLSLKGISSFLVSGTLDMQGGLGGDGGAGGVGGNSLDASQAGLDGAPGGNGGVAGKSGTLVATLTGSISIGTLEASGQSSGRGGKGGAGGTGFDSAGTLKSAGGAGGSGGDSPANVSGGTVTLTAKSADISGIFNLFGASANRPGAGADGGKGTVGGIGGNSGHSSDAGKGGSFTASADSFNSIEVHVSGGNGSALVSAGSGGQGTVGAGANAGFILSPSNAADAGKITLSATNTTLKSNTVQLSADGGDSGKVGGGFLDGIGGQGETNGGNGSSIGSSLATNAKAGIPGTTKNINAIGATGKAGVISVNSKNGDLTVVKISADGGSIATGFYKAGDGAPGNTGLGGNGGSIALFGSSKSATADGGTISVTAPSIQVKSTVTAEGGDIILQASSGFGLGGASGGSSGFIQNFGNAKVSTGKGGKVTFSIPAKGPSASSGVVLLGGSSVTANGGSIDGTLSTGLGADASSNGGTGGNSGGIGAGPSAAAGGKIVIALAGGAAGGVTGLAGIVDGEISADGGSIGGGLYNLTVGDAGKGNGGLVSSGGISGSISNFGSAGSGGSIAISTSNQGAKVGDIKVKSIHAIGGLTFANATIGNGGAAGNSGTGNGGNSGSVGTGGNAGAGGLATLKTTNGNIVVGALSVSGGTTSEVVNIGSGGNNSGKAGNGGNSGTAGKIGNGGNGGIISVSSSGGSIGDANDNYFAGGGMALGFSNSKILNGGDGLNGGDAGSYLGVGSDGNGGKITIATSKGTQVSISSIEAGAGVKTHQPYTSAIASSGGFASKGKGGNGGGFGPGGNAGNGGSLTLTGTAANVQISSLVANGAGYGLGSGIKVGNGGDSDDANGGNAGNVGAQGSAGKGGTVTIKASSLTLVGFDATGGNFGAGSVTLQNGGSSLNKLGTGGTGSSYASVGNAGQGGVVTLTVSGDLSLPGGLAAGGGNATDLSSMIGTNAGGSGITGGNGGSVGNAAAGGKGGVLTISAVNLVTSFGILSVDGGNGMSHKSLGGGDGGEGVNIGGSGGSIGTAGNGGAAGSIKMNLSGSSTDLSFTSISAKGGVGGDITSKSGNGASGIAASLSKQSAGAGGAVGFAGGGGAGGVLKITNSNKGPAATLKLNILDVSGGAAGGFSGSPGIGGSSELKAGSGGNFAGTRASGNAGSLAINAPAVDLSQSGDWLAVGGSQTGVFMGALAGHGGSGLVSGAGGSIGASGSAGKGGSITLSANSSSGANLLDASGGKLNGGTPRSGDGGMGFNAKGSAGSGGSIGNFGKTGDGGTITVTAQNGFKAGSVNAEGGLGASFNFNSGAGGAADSKLGFNGGNGGNVGSGPASGNGGKISISTSAGTQDLGSISVAGGAGASFQGATGVGGIGTGNGKGGNSGSILSTGNSGKGGTVSLSSTSGALNISSITAKGGQGPSLDLSTGIGGASVSGKGIGGSSGNIGNNGGSGAGGTVTLKSGSGDITISGLNGLDISGGNLEPTKALTNAGGQGQSKGGNSGNVGSAGHAGNGGVLMISTTGILRSTDIKASGGDNDNFSSSTGLGGEALAGAGGNSGNVGNGANSGAGGKITINAGDMDPLNNGGLQDIIASGGTLTGSYSGQTLSGGQGTSVGGAAGNLGNGGSAGAGGTISITASTGNMRISRSVFAEGGKVAAVSYNPQAGTGGKAPLGGKGGSVGNSSNGGKGGNITIKAPSGSIDFTFDGLPPYNGAISANGSDGLANDGKAGAGGGDVTAQKGGAGGSVGIAGSGGAAGVILISSKNPVTGSFTSQVISAKGGAGGNNNGIGGNGGAGTILGAGGNVGNAGNGGSGNNITLSPPRQAIIWPNVTFDAKAGAAGVFNPLTVPATGNPQGKLGKDGSPGAKDGTIISLLPWDDDQEEIENYKKKVRQWKRQIAYAGTLKFNGQECLIEPTETEAAEDEEFGAVAFVQTIPAPVPASASVRARTASSLARTATSSARTASIESPLVTESEINSNVLQRLNGYARFEESSHGKIMMVSGTALLFPRRADLLLHTCAGDVAISAGAKALVHVRAGVLAVLNLHDSHRGQVRIVSNGATIDTSMGEEVILAPEMSSGSKLGSEFANLNPIPAISTRDAKSRILSNGQRVFNAEFSMVSAVMNHPAFKGLQKSGKVEHQKEIAQLLKNAVVLNYLTAKRGAFSLSK